MNLRLLKTLEATFILMYVAILLITILFGDGLATKLMFFVLGAGYLWYQWSDGIQAFISAQRNKDKIIVTERK